MTKFSDVLAAGVTIRESANDGSDFSNPSADYRRLFLGEDGLLHVKDSSGTVTSPYSSGGSDQVISAARASKTSGNTTLTSTSEASVDTGIDLTLEAANGDICEVWINGLCGNENVIGNFDVATIVAGSPVNYFGAGLASSAQGLLGWSKQNAGGTYQTLSGSAHKALVSGDISGGNVTLRLRYKVGGNLTLFSSSNTAFYWGAKVLRAAP
jgi:hypothetical protein